MTTCPADAEAGVCVSDSQEGDVLRVKALQLKVTDVGIIPDAATQHITVFCFHHLHLICVFLHVCCQKTHETCFTSSTPLQATLRAPVHASQQVCMWARAWEDKRVRCPHRRHYTPHLHTSQHGCRVTLTLMSRGADHARTHPCTRGEVGKPASS